MASHTCHSVAISLAVLDDRIAVGDLMRGLTLLNYKASNVIDDKFTEVARQPSIMWGTAVEILKSGAIVASDTQGNLQIYVAELERTNKQIVTNLQSIAEFRIGETINRFRRGMTQKRNQTQY